MANISKQKRDKMLGFLEYLKSQHSDDESLKALNEIESALLQKKYGLVWEEHTEHVDEMMKDHIPVFVEDKEREIISDPSLPYNFLLEGDNLHSLKLLEKTHRGKIDLIYIDPPYNTGEKDFIYNDVFVDKIDDFKHSKWLSFMNERLLIARNLLSENGYIFISIDDNEIAPLTLLCDEIFDESNHVNTITVNMNSLSGVKMTHAINGKRFPAQKEYLLLYKKNNKAFPLFIDKKHKDKWDKEYNLIIPELNKVEFNQFKGMGVKDVNALLKKMHIQSLSDYLKENNINRTEEWLWSNSYRIFGTKSNRPLAKKLKDKVFTQQIMSYANNDGNLRFFRTDFNKNVADPRIELVQAEANSSVFLSDNWIDISNDGGVAQEGGITFPKGKKPLQLIKRILSAGNNKNALILDFFAGSGSTGHAALELNKEDNGNRSFILCTNNENNICEKKTYSRLKNVILGYTTEKGKVFPPYKANLKYYKTNFVERYPEDDSLSDILLDHIKEMVQLENAINIDNKHILILDEEDADIVLTNDLSDNLQIYIASDVLLSNNQKQLISQKNITINNIPDYYFNFELKEVGE